MKTPNTLLECDVLSESQAGPQGPSPTATTVDDQSAKPDGYQAPHLPGPSGDEPDGGVKSAQNCETDARSEYQHPGQGNGGPAKKHMYRETAVLLERAAGGYVPPRPPGPGGIPHHFAVSVRDLDNGFVRNLAGLSVILLHETAPAQLRTVAVRVLSPDEKVLFQIVRRFKGTPSKLSVLTLDKAATDSMELYFKPNNMINVTVETSVAIEGASLGIASIHETDD